MGSAGVGRAPPTRARPEPGGVFIPLPAAGGCRGRMCGHGATRVGPGITRAVFGAAGDAVSIGAAAAQRGEILVMLLWHSVHSPRRRARRRVRAEASGQQSSTDLT